MAARRQLGCAGGDSRDPSGFCIVSSHCEAPTVRWHVSDRRLRALDYRRWVKSRRVTSGFAGCVPRFRTSSKVEMSLEKVGHTVLKVEGKNDGSNSAR